ncbi:MAG: SGNH/GDSL hydrolase family protein [Clostridia bacterium]|nr:SGNH/GDSL hydrolase family protein [Clostridia bacterium]
MKRLLSIILTLAMLASTFALAIPTVSATEEDTTVYTEVATLDQFVAALAAKQNIKLTADITLKKNTKYQLYTTTTLNGNGHTIYIPEMDGNINSPFAWAVDTTMENYYATTTIKNINFGSADYPFVHRNTSQNAMALFVGLSSGYSALFENVNLYYNLTTPVAVTGGGLVASTGGTIDFKGCNVFIESHDISTACGGVIGTISGNGVVTMTDCNVYGRVSNEASTASGFVGMLQGSLTMNNCKNYANIASTSTAGAKFAIGGLVAYATASFTKLELNNCINYGNIAGNGNAGGLIGYVETSTAGARTKLNNCINYGNVKAYDGQAAGFVAYVRKVDLTGCINYGTCTGWDAGGFVGNGDNVIFDKCLNAGSIYGERNGTCCAGGFMGIAYTIIAKNSVNIGPVNMMSGKDHGVGNFFSYLSGTATMTNCYAFAPLASATGKEAVIAGQSSPGTVVSTGCKYIDFGAAAGLLGDDCKAVALEDAPALVKSLLNIDVMIGEKDRLVIATPAIRGVQSTTPENGTQSIRVLATMGKALDKIEQVGFKITFTKNGVASEETNYSGKTVFVSINEQIGVESNKITARELNGEYIFSAEIQNVPTVDTTFVITATPWISDGTNTYYGEEKTITYENGEYTEKVMDTTDNLPNPLLYGSPLPQKANTALYKKSVLFCGDSITFGSQDRGVYAPTRTWAGRIAYVHDMDYVNAGIPSAGVSDARAAYSIIVDQAEKYKDREFDFVMLHGGVNDAWGTNGSAPTPVGTVTPVGTTTFDRDTFAGGLENLLYNVKIWYPNAKIGYIINFYAPNEMSGTVSEMSEYVDMTKVICDKYDIPYIDLYNNAELTEKLQVTSRVSAEQTAYIPDHIHPNAGGYDVIYPYIEEFMETELAGGKSSAEPEATLSIGNIDISQYKIIYAAPTENTAMLNYWRPEFDSARLTAQRLADLIEAKFGVKIPVYSDEFAPETAYEILVGNTNRAASATANVTALTTDRYYVGMVGSKLVICGGAAGTTWHAVDGIETYFGTSVADDQYVINQRSNYSGEYHLQRVAFIGDSITYGAITTDYTTNGSQRGFVKQTGRVDWRESVVTGYGSPGTRLVDFMNISLWSTFCADAQANPYDEVVIMLGINDANVADKASGWSSDLDASFTAALETMVKSIDSMNPNAEIVIMTCAVHYRTTAAGYTGTCIVSSANVVALQKATAQSLKNAGYNVHLFDMNAYSTANISQAMFDSDCLHPADAGHEVMARGVAKMLQLLREGKTDQYLLY